MVKIKRALHSKALFFISNKAGFVRVCIGLRAYFVHTCPIDVQKSMHMSWIFADLLGVAPAGAGII